MTINIPFNANGGDFVGEQNVQQGVYGKFVYRTYENGAVVDNYPSVTRSGYVFLGWYSDRTGGVEVPSGTWRTGNVLNEGSGALWARWGVTVTFNANGGTAVTPATKNVEPGLSLIHI